MTNVRSVSRVRKAASLLPLGSASLLLSTVDVTGRLKRVWLVAENAHGDGKERNLERSIIFVDVCLVGSYLSRRICGSKFFYVQLLARSFTE